MEAKNPTVHFSTIKNARHNAIQNWYEEPWVQLKDMILEQKHVPSDTKDVLLISPWKYRTTDDDFTPRTTDDGELWLYDGKPVVGRLADNVIGTSMLMFDFDGEVSITLAKHMFSTYTHLGYTSYSHMSPKKDGKDCFRVIVPLARFVTAQQLVDRRNAIYAAFPGVDPSCLSLSRSFYVPSCAPERKHVAHMWDSIGKLFDVMEFQPDIYTPPLKTPSYVIDNDETREKVFHALKNVYLGHEPEWFKVACAMYANDYTFAEFCEVSINGLMKEKNAKQCADKWKSAERSVGRGQSMTLGYLVNLCKKHNVWTPAASARENMKKLVRSAA